MISVLAGLDVLVICQLGAYVLEKEQSIKHPAYFVAWGYVCGLVAATVMRVYS